MMDFIELVLRPQMLVMTLAAVAAFATVLTIAMPVISRDRISQRMKVMATERDKMRTLRLAELKKEGPGAAKLRQAPKGFMQQLVDTFGVRSRYDVGVERILWSSDYPHAASTWPHSRQVITDELGHLPKNVIDKVVRQNVLDLYHIKVDGINA